MGTLCVLLTAFAWSLAETQTTPDDQSCKTTLKWVPAFCSKISTNSNMTQCGIVDRTIADTCLNIGADTRENISACNMLYLHHLCNKRITKNNKCSELKSGPCNPENAGADIHKNCEAFRGVCHNLSVNNEPADPCEQSCVQNVRWFCGRPMDICYSSSTEPLTESSSSATVSLSSGTTVSATSTYPDTEGMSEVADDSDGVQVILWITYATLGVMAILAGIQCVRVVVKRRRRRHKTRREMTIQSETRINRTYNTDSAATGDSVQDGAYAEIPATPSSVRFGQHGTVALNVAQRVSSLEHHYETVTPLMVGHHEHATPQATRSDAKQVYTQLCVQTLVEHTYTKLPCNTAANSASIQVSEAGDCTESQRATQNVIKAIIQSKQNFDGTGDSGHDYYQLEKDTKCDHTKNARHGSISMEDNVPENRNSYYVLEKLDKPHEVNVGMDKYEHSTNARDGSISMEESVQENRNSYYILEKLDKPSEVNIGMDNGAFYHKLETLDDSQAHTSASRSITVGDASMETSPVCTSGAAAPGAVAGNVDTFLDSGIVDDNRYDLQGGATHYYTLEKQGDSRERVD